MTDPIIEQSEEAQAISVHDNFILSYTVECEAKRITIHTAFLDSEPNEHTDVLFEDVLAYYFEGDALSTILFDIEEASANTVYDTYEAVFTRRKNYGWPTLKYDSREGLLQWLQSEGYHAFGVNSSLGMDGFVLAKEMRFVRVT